MPKSIFSQFDENKKIEDILKIFQVKYNKYKKISEMDKQFVYLNAENVRGYLNIIQKGKKEFTKEQVIGARLNLWIILGYIFLLYFDGKL